ncbi:hypothetical protein [Mesoterricola silvestris]|nr:hypothetical protein [Mesoterricola silvestris]
MRLFLQAFTLLAAGGSYLIAQSYQSNFGDIKFDRNKSPATWHGISDVESSTGALSINIPMGPGIGARGAKWIPTIRGRWAPQIAGMSSTTVNSAGGIAEGSWTQTTHNGSLDFSPGHLKLTICDYASEITNPNAGSNGPREDSDLFTYYSLPDGTSGSYFGAIDFTGPNALSTGLDPVATIAAFGFEASAGWSVATDIAVPTNVNPGPYVRLGQSGEVVIGLYKPGEADTRICVPLTGQLGNGQSSDNTCPRYPGRILVVKGDIAYEFVYRATKKTGLIPLDETDRNSPKVQAFRWATFGLASIRNRQGDAIKFTNDLTNDTFLAKWYLGDWSTDTGQAILVTGTTPFGTSESNSFSVNYQGNGNQPSYTVGGVHRVAPYGSAGEDTAGTKPGFGIDGFISRAVDSVVDNISDQTISLTYAELCPEFSVSPLQ